MTTPLTISVSGIPVPQGSKVANRFGGGVRDANANRLRPWRDTVDIAATTAARYANWDTTTAPVRVDITFNMPRPKNHYGTGRNAGILKPNAPFWCTTTPDLDKLVRAIHDSLTTAQVYKDDSQIVASTSVKPYANTTPGVHITVTVLDRHDPALNTPEGGRP